MRAGHYRPNLFWRMRHMIMALSSRSVIVIIIMVLIIKRNKTQFEFEIIFSSFSRHLESVAVKWGKVSHTDKNLLLDTKMFFWWRKKNWQEKKMPQSIKIKSRTPDTTFMTHHRKTLKCPFIVYQQMKRPKV